MKRVFEDADAVDNSTISITDEQKKKIESSLKELVDQDPKLKKKFDGGLLLKICKSIFNMIANSGFSKAYMAINKTTFGNMDGAIKDIISSEIKDMDKNELTEMANKLIDKYPEIKIAQKKEEKEKKLDSREDENTNTELNDDPKTYKMSCIFDNQSGGDELIKVINQIKSECKQTTENVKDTDKEAKSKISKMKLSLDKKTIDEYTPQIYAMIENGKNKKEIETAINKLKDSVEESLNRSLGIIGKNILREHKRSIISEHQKRIYKAFISYNLSNKIVSEGLGEWITSKVMPGSSSVSNDVVDKIDFNAHISTASGEHGIAFFRNAEDIKGSIPIEVNGQTIVKTGLIGASAFSAWLPVLVAAAMAITYKYKKQIRNAIQKSYQKMLNKGGGIAELEFQTMGEDEKKKPYKYVLQFSIKDFKWRCLNKKNILHYPSKELLKAALDSELGKKFRKFCESRWNPIFEPAEPGEVAGFATLINYSNGDKLVSKKEKKMLKDFGANWERIKKDCLSDDYKFDIRPRGGSVVSNS